MAGDEVAWILLRVVYAWMFLYPALGLIQQWPTTVQTTSLLFRWQPGFFALGSVAFMVVGGVMILLGVYGWVAGAGFCAFSVGGALVHYRLAARAGAIELSAHASREDVATLEGLAALAIVGHVTSAQKNFVLAAVGSFFFLVGTGPLSVVGSAPPF
ncbi:MAG: DoxX family membrane protein [Candidatus Binatia bacterium]|nr:DoxX family membrane protein [Candidatus Binatia bacterium]